MTILKNAMILIEWFSYIDIVCNLLKSLTHAFMMLFVSLTLTNRVWKLNYEAVSTSF